MKTAKQILESLTSVNEAGGKQKRINIDGYEFAFWDDGKISTFTHLKRMDISGLQQYIEALQELEKAVAKHMHDSGVNEADNAFTRDEFEKKFADYVRSESDFGLDPSDIEKPEWDQAFKMYKDDATFHEILKAMEKSAGLNEDARQMASSSDKSKFKSLKSQIEKLEQDKEKIRDEISKAHGSDDKKKIEGLQDKRTQIIEKIKKLGDEKRKMMGKFRQLSTKD